jgi:N-glycosylase/DNA lyase
MTSGKITLPPVFSLGLTLLCGQCFRWEGPDEKGWFSGVAGGAFWRLRQEGCEMEWECGEGQVRGKPALSWISHYLGLDEDLSGWMKVYETHPVLEKPLQVLKGLRLIRQEPWECAVSYMFAQGLSVKVIRGALRKFCAGHGSPIGSAPGFFDFPEASRLAGLSPALLKPFTNNYQARADRIIRAARAVEAKVISLEHLKTIDCDEARSALMGLDGIGPKIADCILLFSLDQVSAFPVDRWVLRAMKRHFRSVKLLGAGEEAPTPSQYHQIVKKARHELGERCGLASEYLFLYLRLLEDAKLRQELEPYLGPGLPPLALKTASNRKPVRKKSRVR